MKTVNTHLVLAMALAITAITGTAQASGRPSTKIIAKGAEAKAMYEGMNVEETTSPYTALNGLVTKIKVQNLTDGWSSRIAPGETGIMCEKYESPEAIKLAGTDYLCAMLKL